jgi:hypothetical protein
VARAKGEYGCRALEERSRKVVIVAPTEKGALCNVHTPELTTMIE